MPVNSISMYTHFKFNPTTSTTFLNPNTRKLNTGRTHFPTFKCNLNLSFHDILAVTHNKVLIAAGVSAAIGQLSKPFTGVLLYGRPFDVKAVFQAGGFPSTHSSAVVATATCLALERGFGDSIFGMAAVYAGLIMYDAQGVRREVGIHAKTLNKLLLESQTTTVTDVNKDIVNSVPGKPSSTNLESLTTLEESGVSRKEHAASTQLLDYKSQRSTNEEEFTSFRTVGKESEIARLPSLKESIGHTEVEVIAGALLGFVVSLTVNAVM